MMAIIAVIATTTPASGSLGFLDIIGTIRCKEPEISHVKRGVTGGVFSDLQVAGLELYWYDFVRFTKSPPGGPSGGV